MLRCSANCLQCYQKPNDTLCKLKSVFRKLFETDEQLQTQAKKLLVFLFIHGRKPAGLFPDFEWDLIGYGNGSGYK